MAKRKSTIDDIIEITTRLPGWVGILLAVVSYMLLHAYATSEAQSIDLRDGSGIAGGLFKSIATIGQYIFPAVFALGAIGSLIKRKKQDHLYSKASTHSPLQEISKMSWRDFEQLTAAAFRKQGFRVQDTNDGPDGGIDLILKKDGEIHLVQCKHWRAYKVGVKVVRELYGVIASTGATGGYVVTAGKYTQEAKAFAENINIELIDGDKLEQWFIQPEQVEFAVSEEDSILSHRLAKHDRPKFVRSYSKVGVAVVSIAIIICAFYGLYWVTSKQLEKILAPATDISMKQESTETNARQRQTEKPSVTEPGRNAMISTPGTDDVEIDGKTEGKLSFVDWYKELEECLASKTNPNPDITECANQRIRARHEYMVYLRK